MCCGVGRRLGSDPTLLWLWCRPAAVALIQPLAWEVPYAIGGGPRKQKKKKKKKDHRNQFYFTKFPKLYNLVRVTQSICPQYPLDLVLLILLFSAHINYDHYGATKLRKRAILNNQKSIPLKSKYKQTNKQRPCVLNDMS